MMILGAMILAHLLYDFHWQGDFIGQYKSKYDFLLLVHSTTWALLISAVLYYFGIFLVWKFFFLWITHHVIDYWKCRKLDKTYALTSDLWIDQALHLITIVAVIV